jgi:hypothetical protein
VGTDNERIFCYLKIFTVTNDRWVMQRVMSNERHCHISGIPRPVPSPDLAFLVSVCKM